MSGVPIARHLLSAAFPTSESKTKSLMRRSLAEKSALVRRTYEAGMSVSLVALSPCSPLNECDPFNLRRFDGARGAKSLRR